jgi:hypothetical protein
MSKAVTVLYQGWWWKQFSPFFRGLLIFSLLVTHCALYIQFVLPNLAKNLERKYAWKFFNLLMCSFKFNMLSFDNLANVHKYVHTTYITSCFFYMTEDAKNVKWFPTFIRLHCYVTLKIDFKIPFLVIWNEHWTGLVYIFQIWRLKKKHSIGKICEGLKKTISMSDHKSNMTRIDQKWALKNLPGSYKKHRHAFEHAFFGCKLLHLMMLTLSFAY